MSNHIYVILLILLVITVSCNNPETEKKLALAAEVMDANPDSAKKILETITHKTIISKEQNAKYALLYTQALDKCELLTGSDSLISIATKYFNDNDPENAGYAWFYKARCAKVSSIATERANSLLKAEEFSENSRNNYLKALVYYEKADMYKEQFQHDSSIIYFKKMWKTFDKTNDKRNISLALLNIGIQFSYTSNQDSSLYYYKKAEYINYNSHDSVLLSTIYRCIAGYFTDKKEYNLAITYYKKIPLTNIPMYDSNTFYIIAKIYLYTNNVIAAKYYLKKVTDIVSFEPDYYALWQSIYTKEKNLEKALLFASKVNDATNLSYKKNLQESFAGLEKKYKYQNLQISNQQLTIKNNKNRIIILLILLIFSIVLIVFQAYRVKVRKKQLRDQAEILKREKALFEKVKENNSLLARQFKLQEVLLEHVEQYKRNSLKAKSNEELNPTKNKTFYQDIITYLDFEFPDFPKKLKENFPKLTELDILICYLLVAGFESGMIATILNVKIDSINKQRYRLRTRLELANSENLIDFLRNM